MNTNPNTHCPRCLGSGYLAKFKHVSGGNCFACNGTGVNRLHVAEFEAAELALLEASKPLTAADLEASAAAPVEHFDPLALLMGLPA